MTEAPSSYRCGACGRRVASAVNRCPSCHALGRFVPCSEPPETKPIRIRPLARPAAPRGFSNISPLLIEKYARLSEKLAGAPPPTARLVAQKLFDVEAETRARFSTQNPVLDRAFGTLEAPGIAERSTSIFAGMPGTFKTTLVLEALAAAAHLHGIDVLFLETEMSASFLREYADRIRLFRRFPGARAHFSVVEVQTIGEALRAIDELDVSLYALDSLQAACQKDGTSIVEAAKAFTHRCERSPQKPSRTGIHIGHGTKDGDMSGTMAAMHEVDALFLLEFFHPLTHETLAPKHRLDVMRICNAKNRFSDARGIVGAFSLGKTGPAPLVDSIAC